MARVKKLKARQKALEAAKLAGIDLATLEAALPGITDLPSTAPTAPATASPTEPPLTLEEQMQRLHALQSQATRLKVLKAGEHPCHGCARAGRSPG